MPFFTMITIDSTVGLRAWVPIDDDYHMLINMSGKEKQERKQRLDSMLSNSLQETLERKAQSYKKKGMEKQAKKIRAFKKEVRKFVGSL